MQGKRWPKGMLNSLNRGKPKSNKKRSLGKNKRPKNRHLRSKLKGHLSSFWQGTKRRSRNRPSLILGCSERSISWVRKSKSS
jgi:hypothetical protein